MCPALLYKHHEPNLPPAGSLGSRREQGVEQRPDLDPEVVLGLDEPQPGEGGHEGGEAGVGDAVLGDVELCSRTKG